MKCFNMKLYLFFLMIFSGFGLFAQSPIGVWKTIDEKSNQPKSHVEIYEKNGKLFGKVVKLLPAAATKTCDKCPGDKKGKALETVDIIENLQIKDGFYQNGTIIDPLKGEFSCSLWLSPENKDILIVKGKHWSGLSRKQSWYRVK